MANLKRNTRVWAWWLSRYLWYKREYNGAYFFEDVDGNEFALKETELVGLEKR